MLFSVKKFIEWCESNNNNHNEYWYGIVQALKLWAIECDMSVVYNDHEEHYQYVVDRNGNIYVIDQEWCIEE